MKIFADENIPLVKEAFAHLGEVITFKGRELNREQILKADVLLVRSVTKVSGNLVRGSRLRFVGTATIGTDHVECETLSELGIHFASAPGSNANSVGEYVIAALLALASDRERDWRGKTLGIVGVGNCGSRVEALAPALGLELRFCDPPLARETGDTRYRPLLEIADADILTFHVPLTKTGPDPTYHLINEDLLARRPPQGVVINASRGAVADSVALRRHFGKESDQLLVLDVWEGEPAIETDLLELTALGTPHIAGYSYDGKVKGMLMLYEALCGFLGVKAKWFAAPFMTRDAEPFSLEKHSDFLRALDSLIRRCYDIRFDDQNLRNLLRISGSEQADYFDGLRKNYRERREFPSYEVSPAGVPKDLISRIQCLGFQLTDANQGAGGRSDDGREEGQSKRERIRLSRNSEPGTK